VERAATEKVRDEARRAKRLAHGASGDKKAFLTTRTTARH
jgi:hypothetical protein